MKWSLQAHWMRNVVNRIVHVCRTVNYAGKRMDAALAGYFKRAFALPAPKKRSMLMLEPLEGLIMPATFGFAQNVNFVRESAGQATITVQRLDPAIDSASINFATADGSATVIDESIGDYEAANSTLSFEEGQTSAVITINVQGYGSPTAFKYFTINLVADEETVATTTVTIIENDATNGPLVADSSHFTNSNVTLTGGGEEDDDPGLMENTYDPEENEIAITGINIGQSDYDPEDEIEMPSGATLTVFADGTFSYEPVPGFSGIEPFAITYSNGTDTSTAVAYVNVSSNPAIASNVVYNLTQNTVLYAGSMVVEDPTQPGLLESAVDPDDNDLEITDFTVGETTYDAGDVAEITDVGTLQVCSNGDVIFTPDSEFTGYLMFDYSIDNGQLPTTASAFIIVNAPLPTEGDLIAWNGSYTVIENNTLEAGDGHDERGITQFAFDPENNELEITKITVLDEYDVPVDYDPGEEIVLASGAHLTVESNGDVTFEPAQDFTGTESFTFTIGNGSTEEMADVEITVAALPPIALGMVYTAEVNEPLGVGGAEQPPGLLQNCSDPTGHTLTVTAVNDYSIEYEYISTTQGGNVTFQSDGSFTYTPPVDFEGSDSFTFTVSNGTETVTATCTIIVHAPLPEENGPEKFQQIQQLQNELNTTNSIITGFTADITSTFRSLLSTFTSEFAELGRRMTLARNSNNNDNLQGLLESVYAQANNGVGLNLNDDRGYVTNLSVVATSWAEHRAYLRLLIDPGAINQVRQQLRAFYVQMAVYQMMITVLYNRVINGLDTFGTQIANRIEAYNGANTTTIAYDPAVPLDNLKMNRAQAEGFRSLFLRLFQNT